MKAIRLFASLLLVVSLLVSSCSTSRPKVSRERPVPQVPVAVLVGRVINAPILHVPLRMPTGLAVDFRGDIYLCDQGNNRIIKFRGDLFPEKDRGGYGTQPGLFILPRYAAIDNQLNLWVSDTQNRRIVRMDAELNYVDAVPFSDKDDPSKFGEPSGVGVTSFGALWIADKDQNRVALFDNVGQFEKFVGDFGTTGGQLSRPEKVFIDADELYYVCDPGNGRVVVYDSYGTLQRTLSDDAMESPVAVAVDRHGGVWVLDQVAVRLFCFDSEGHNLAEGGVVLTGGGSQPMAPSDLIFMKSDSLLISDGEGNQLLVCNVIYK